MAQSFSTEFLIARMNQMLCCGMGNGEIKWNAFGRMEFNIWAGMQLSETLLSHQEVLVHPNGSTPFIYGDVEIGH